MNIEKVLLSEVALNNANPRKISDSKLRQLMERLIVFPKMMSLRPVVVDNDMVALGGNMRIKAFMAISQLSIEDIESIASHTKNYKSLSRQQQQSLIDYWNIWLDKPTIQIVKANELTDAEKREFIIADNVAYGEWDWESLELNWDAVELSSWGLDLNFGDDEAFTTEEKPKKDLSDTIEMSYKIEIQCEDEAHQEYVYNKLTEEGYECRILTL